MKNTRDARHQRNLTLGYVRHERVCLCGPRTSRAGSRPRPVRGPTIANRERMLHPMSHTLCCGVRYTRVHGSVYLHVRHTIHIYTSWLLTQRHEDRSRYTLPLRTPVSPSVGVAARYSTNYHLKSCTRVKYSTQRADIESMLSSSVHHSPSQMVPSSVCHAIVCLCLPHPQHSPPLHAPTPPPPHGGPQHSEAVWIFS